VEIAESFKTALRMLDANRVRSGLTMLGIAMGVAAVILLVSIGTGVKASVSGQLEGLGSNLVFVFPQSLEQLRAGGGGNPYAIKNPLTDADVELLSRRLAGDAIVVPVLQANVSIRAGNRYSRTRMAAGSELGAQVFTATVASGRHYTRAEWLNAARVVALGAEARDALFPGRDPVGQSIDIEGQRFKVVGTYLPKGGSLAGSEDNQIYVPSTTAQRLLGVDGLSQIVVKAAEPERVDDVKARVAGTLRPGRGDEFTVLTQEETLGIVSSLLGTLTAMLAGIAGISLLVGGIGIMNIMLVSVSERTREIGIRKAVGARGSDIMRQFVTEAALLSTAGGVAGIALGVALAVAVRTWVPSSISAWTVGLAFFFSAAVGLFFGVYPAYRASRLDPIEALRYE
jgi:putative ABC transport system permease protein